MSRIIVGGDRNWSDAVLIAAALRDVGATHVLVQVDELDGAFDAFAVGACFSEGIEVSEYRGTPWWRTRERMFAEGNVQRVVVFHDWFAGSSRTLDLVRRAKVKGLSVSLYSHYGIEEF